MERDVIAWVRERLPPHPLLRLGPGDDAAILRMAGIDECLITVDLLTDQVDFVLEKVDPRRVGRKALAVNLSDIAAMAGRPLAAVISVALPRLGGRDLALQLFEGILPLAEKYNVAIAGGDTNSWDGPLVISITVLGEVVGRGALCRSGARPGDRILVTGSFGGSIAGKQFDFVPRIDEALRLNECYELHAGIDVSDGLSIDLAHILHESGCGAVVDIASIPISGAAHRLALETASDAADRKSPLEHALSDGEDFELILAVPPEEAQRMIRDQPLAIPLTEIGVFTDTPGMWQTEAGSPRKALIPSGWEHKFT